MKRCFVCLLTILACFTLVGCGKEENNNITGENKPVEKVTFKNDKKELNLNKDYEKYEINDVILEFYGEEKDEGYSYVLTLKFGEVEINSSVFSNPYQRFINSSNLNSKFNIYSIDDLYILVASTGASVDGEYGLILDKNGNFIDSYEDRTINVDIKNKTINISYCVDKEDNSTCNQIVYKVNKDKLTY